jgi:hypothetical protein
MRGVNDNWNEQIKVLRLQIDQDKARALGVSSQGIAQASRTILVGTTIGQYREGDKLIDIVLRQPLDERNAITDLGNAYLPTSRGRTVPLTQIAKVIDLAWEPGVLWREGRTLRHHRAGRRGRRRAGPDRHGAAVAAAAGAASRQHAAGLRHRASPARWKRAARARAASPPACR